MAAQQIPFIPGGTATYFGLDLLVEEFSAKGCPASQGVPRIAIVVTDGGSNNFYATSFAAWNVHEIDIITYAVGIGDSINQQELLVIADTTGLVDNI